jgi:hypothetical protein
MKNGLMIIALVALVLMTAMPAQARTITMSNPGGIAERDIVVYWSNGTMYGYYNASSVITIDNESDYLFTMKPLSSNPLEDPTDWLGNTAFPFVTSNVIGIFLIVLLAAYWKMR